MIYLVHENNEVIRVLDKDKKPFTKKIEKSITNTLFQLAKDNPHDLIIWCHREYLDFINEEKISEIFHHKGILASYSPNKNSYLPEEIGYVDQSIFINVNKKVLYPTWLMSSDVGGINADLLNVFFKNIKRNTSFDYFINSMARKAMPQGLFCYSDPRLLKNKADINVSKKASSYQLFRFVKEHYKKSWVIILFISCLIFEKRVLIFPLFYSLFFKNSNNSFEFSDYPINSSLNIIKNREVDVIIPTIGRKSYLLNTLKDLVKQTIVPKNVIIIEQNPDKNSLTELDYLTQQKWPFNIKHQLIHQTGVCNARNLALAQIESEWTFLADDDIEFEPDLIKKILDRVKKYGVKAINTVCLQPGEKQLYTKTSQTTIFGSGTSVVKSDVLTTIKFDESFEFGYGEDSDFGMQIRNQGVDVIFLSDILITHLKASIGGYRIKNKNLWDDYPVSPKPSPTVMLFKQKYFTKQQILGYKFLLFVKFYNRQPIKNPIRYISFMKKSWKSSLYWCQKIQK